MVYMFETQVTANAGFRDRPENIVYLLEGKGIDMSMFDVNRTTGEISVLKVIKVLGLPRHGPHLTRTSKWIGKPDKVHLELIFFRTSAASFSIDKFSKI